MMLDRVGLGWDISSPSRNSGMTLDRVGLGWDISSHLGHCSLEHKVCHREGGGVGSRHVDEGCTWLALVSLTHEVDT